MKSGGHIQRRLKAEALWVVKLAPQKVTGEISEGLVSIAYADEITPVLAEATSAIAGATAAQSSRACRAFAGTHDGGRNRVVGCLIVHCWKL